MRSTKVDGSASRLNDRGTEAGERISARGYARMRRTKVRLLGLARERKGHAAGDFCTPVHRFAQTFDHNLIDAAKGKDYLAPQIEPGSFRTLRINLEGAASVTAVAPRD